MKYKFFTLLEPGPRKIIEEEKKYPRLFKVLEPLGRRLDEFIENRIGINLDRLETYVHPQEDYFSVSERYPIFAVADGVTLEFNQDGTYPVPSGAGEAARIFCETVIKESEKTYDNFSKDALKEVFRKANESVGNYNQSRGRTKEKINYWDFDLFASTAAFAAIKDNILYWFSICDSYVSVYGNDGQPKLFSPECWDLREKYLPPAWDKTPENEKKKIIRKVYRNGLNENGEKIGYGVITGEPNAELYLNYGSISLKEGDTVFLFTDGFEEYMKLPDFVDIFKEWSGDFESEVKGFTHKKSKDNGSRFGHERTLIAVNYL